MANKKIQMKLRNAENTAWDNLYPVVGDGAINDAKLATDVKVGSLALLDTTVKSDIVSAINELFLSASDGKGAIATAITGMGGTANSSDSFNDLATEIGSVATWDADLIADNIKKDVDIFGVVGTHESAPPLTSEDFVIDTGETITAYDLVDIVASSEKIKAHDPIVFSKAIKMENIDSCITYVPGAMVVFPLTAEYGVISYIRKTTSYLRGFKIVGNKIRFGVSSLIGVNCNASVFPSFAKLSNTKFIMSGSLSSYIYAFVVDMNTSTLALSKGASASYVVHSGSLVHSLIPTSTTTALIMYYDTSKYPCIRPITVTGDSLNQISWGTATVILSTISKVQYGGSLCRISDTKAIAVYANGDMMDACVVNIDANGTTITLNTPTTLDVCSSEAYFNDSFVLALSETEFFVHYKRYQYSTYALVFDISGNSINSVGTPVALGNECRGVSSFIINSGLVRVTRTYDDSTLTENERDLSISSLTIVLGTEKIVGNTTYNYRTELIDNSRYIQLCSVRDYGSSSYLVNCILYSNGADGIALEDGVATDTIPVYLF